MGKPTKNYSSFIADIMDLQIVEHTGLENLIPGQLIGEHQGNCRALVDIWLVNCQLRPLHENPKINIMSLIKKYLVLQNLSNYPVLLCAMI